MDRRRTWIAVGIAVILAIVAVYIANTFLIGAQKKAELAGTTQVAVAAVPLEYGTQLTREKIRFVQYPNTAIPAGSFHNLNEILPPGQNRVALMAMQPNEPILPGKISAPGAGASIAALLPAGMRATSVRINDVSGVAGFIQPNDSVDVLITRQMPTGEQVTDVLMQSVRVLAIGQNSKGEDGKPISANTATLAVDQVGAQKLALAQQAGSLSLVLRKPGEQDNPVVETVSLNDLRYSMYGGVNYPPPATVGVYQEPAPKPAPVRRPVRAAAPKASRPVPTTSDIEVYRGTQSNNYTVGS